MTRKKDPELEIEALQKIIKEQRGTIKSLRKQISRKDKRVSDVEDLESRLAEAHLKDDAQDVKYISNDRCPEPGCLGTIEQVPLGNRMLFMCDMCKFRKPSKPLK